MKKLTKLALVFCMAFTPILASAQEFSKPLSVLAEKVAARKVMAERSQGVLQEVGVRSDAPTSGTQSVIVRTAKDSVSPGSEIVLDIIVTEYIPEVPIFYGVVFTPSPETAQAGFGLHRFPVQLDSSDLAQSAPGLRPGIYRAVAKFPTRVGDIKGDYVFDVATVNVRTGIRVTEDTYVYVHVGKISQFGRPYIYAGSPTTDTLATADSVVVKIPGRFPAATPTTLVVIVEDGARMQYFTRIVTVPGPGGALYAALDRASLRAIGRAVNVSFVLYEDQLSTSMSAYLIVEP